MSDTIGGYLLDALCDRETAEFRQHIANCQCCRREISYLTPVARFLTAFKAAVREDDVREDFDTMTVLLGYKPAWEVTVPAQRRSQ
jgi:hypothetical protein